MVLWGISREIVLSDRLVFMGSNRLERWFLLVEVVEVMVRVVHMVGGVIIKKSMVEIEVVVM